MSIIFLIEKAAISTVKIYIPLRIEYHTLPKGEFSDDEDNLHSIKDWVSLVKYSFSVFSFNWIYIPLRIEYHSAFWLPIFYSLSIYIPLRIEYHCFPVNKLYGYFRNLHSIKDWVSSCKELNKNERPLIYIPLRIEYHQV